MHITQRIYRFFAPLQSSIFYLLIVALSTYFLFFLVIPVIKQSKEILFFQKQIEKSLVAEQYLKKHHLQQKDYQKKIGLQFQDFEELHNVLLAHLNQFIKKKDVRIVHIETPEVNETKTKLTANTIVTLSGNYYDLIRVIHQLESQKELGLFKQVSFTVEEQKFEQQVDLILKIHLKNIKFKE